RLVVEVPPLSVLALATLAWVLLAAGRAGEALVAATEALDLLTTLGQVEEGTERTLLVHAEALHATGQVDAARAPIPSAPEKLRARAARIGTPSLRASFLEKVTENARTLALAEAWLAGD